MRSREDIQGRMVKNGEQTEAGERGRAGGQSSLEG